MTIEVVDAEAAEEGSDTATFRITRSGPTTSDLKVKITRSGATFGATGDYTLSVPDAAEGSINTGGTEVTIKAGQTSVDVLATPVDDTKIESDESITLTLGASALYSLSADVAERSATATIADNETRVMLEVLADEASENTGTPGVVRFTRTGPTAAALTVRFTLTGTAKLTSDYTLTRDDDDDAVVGGMVVIKAGESFADVNINPVLSSEFEADETVIVTLSADAAYSLPTLADDRVGTVTIVDIND